MDDNLDLYLDELKDAFLNLTGLDITTNLEKPEKQFVPCFFHLILKEEEDESKKIDIEPHHD